MPGRKAQSRKWKNASALWAERFFFDRGVVVGNVCLLFAIVLVVIWAVGAVRIEGLARQTLANEREANPQGFKGIESFVLSTFDKTLGADKAESVPEPTKMIFAKLQAAFSAKPRLNERDVNVDDFSEELKRSVATDLAKTTHPSETPTALSKEYITDEIPIAVLFVPAVAFPTNASGAAPIPQPDLEVLLRRAPQLSRDILASRQVVPYLKELTEAPILSGGVYPIQAYVITRTGVLRIRRRDTDENADQHLYYKDRFTAHRFFPERPHYWKTIEGSEESEHSGNKRSFFDLTSKPYVDLGGNGIVKTFCKAMIPGYGNAEPSEATVCVDIRLPVDIKATLDRSLYYFGGAKGVEIHCYATSKHPDDTTCGPGTDETVSMAQRNLKNLVTVKGAPDEMFGGTYVLNQANAELHSASVQGGKSEESPSGAKYLTKVVHFFSEKVYFTVPTGPIQSPSQTGETLLLYEVNLAAPQWRNLILGVLAAAFFMLAVAVRIFAKRVRARALKFLRDLEEVVEVTPQPFCRLDESDRIVGANSAFRDLLGVDEQQLRDQEFAALLADSNSRARYDLVQARRRDYAMTPPYEVRIASPKGAGKATNIVISGASLDAPTATRGSGSKVPVTFGVLVRPDDVKGNYLQLSLPISEFKAALESAGGTPGSAEGGREIPGQSKAKQSTAEQEVVRYPSLGVKGRVRPACRLTIIVDLQTGLERGGAHDPIVFSGLDPGQTEFSMKTLLSCPHLVFDRGTDHGTVTVRRDRPSVPFVAHGTVAPDLPKNVTQISILASFYYQARFCGSHEEILNVERADEGAGSGSAPPNPDSAEAPRIKPVHIEPAAPSPRLTVQIHHPLNTPDGILEWTMVMSDEVREECADLPDANVGSIDLEGQPEVFAQKLLEDCEHIIPSDHMQLFLGAGQLIWDRTPEVFRKIYGSMRRRYGVGFPVQFVTDEPYIPWELMTVEPYDPGHPFLNQLHPVGRWLLQYDCKRRYKLMPGHIATVAPRYDRGGPPPPPLPQAQVESAQIQRDFAAIAIPVTGEKAQVLDLLKDKWKLPIGIFHFAGHGDAKLTDAAFARILLEQKQQLTVLEVRAPNVLLGEHYHTLAFFNACRVGETNKTLGVVGGWAEALTSKHFGGFIAPLWAVYDSDAALVSTTFFRFIVTNKMEIGEALRRIRYDFGHKSPTYLSYMYYGDVLARFISK